jgi:NDP-sugar pyrophosphorylase family protein
MISHNQPVLLTAAILAGGLGTRLRPVIEDSPKVLAPVAHRPFITFVLDQLAAAGIRRVVLLTGYRAAHVRRILGDRYAGMTLVYSVEASPLGTAGALRQALPKLATETVLLLNGDSFCEVNLPCLVTEHRRCQAELTLTLAEVSDTSRFGQVEMALDGRITRFKEKEGGGPGWINAGVYVLAKSLVAETPPRQFCSLERDLLPGWAHSKRLYGSKVTGRFLDIGTPSSYAGADAFFAERDNLPALV